MPVSPGPDLGSLVARYQSNTLGARLGVAQNNALAQGQAPQVMVIACADSRVDPALWLGAKAGELFVVRNVANVVPAESTGSSSVAAAINFAISGLGVSDIVVLGHSDCGGIKALMSADDHGVIDTWMSHAKKARQGIQVAESNRACAECEHAALLLSRENLLNFSLVSDAVSAGKLSVHAWYLDLARMAITAYNADTEQFVSL